MPVYEYGKIHYDASANARCWEFLTYDIPGHKVVSDNANESDLALLNIATNDGWELVSSHSVSCIEEDEDDESPITPLSAHSTVPEYILRRVVVAKP